MWLKPDKYKKFSFDKIILAVIILIITAFYYFTDLSDNPVLPVCIFHKFTGFYCPGCGGQRAFQALLHRKPLDALQYNPLIYIILPLILLKVLQELFPGYYLNRLIPGKTFFWSVICLICAFWILRNVQFYPFNLLAPKN